MEGGNACKRKDEIELKRRIVTMSVFFFILFPAGIALTIAGGVIAAYPLIGTGLCLLFASIAFRIFLSGRITELKERIKNYCPNCGHPTLAYVRTTKEKTGTFKVSHIPSQGTIKKELVREVNYYKCKNCGYETHSEILNELHPDW